MNKKLRTEFNSRQYMINKDFELYYYSDTDIKNVQIHSHNYYELYFFIKGNVLIDISGNTLPLKSGDVVIIPPKKKHRLTVQSQTMPYQRFILWISEEFYNQLLTISPDFGYLFHKPEHTQNYIYHFDVISFNTIQVKIIELLEEMHSFRFGNDALISSCINSLIMTISRMIYESENQVITRENPSLYQNILKYIETHIKEDISLDSIANSFYVSKYHIAHTFKNQMGLSIHQYALKKRLSLCKAAIASGSNISTAFLECGFRDYSSFYRAFKKEFGISPKEYKSSLLEIMDKQL